MKSVTGYTVEMTLPQWDVVVLALGYVYDRAYWTRPNSVGVIDEFARTMLRRRLDEAIAEIQSNVPEAGLGESIGPKRD